MPLSGLCKKFLHVGPGEMVIEVAPALPLFEKMHYPGRGRINNQFVPGAACLAADHGHDLLYVTDKLPLPFRHKGTSCINKYHTSPSLRGIRLSQGYPALFSFSLDTL